MVDPVSIDTVQQFEPETVNIDAGGTKPPVPPEVASLRAAKARFGLYPDYTDKSHQEIQDVMTGGQEDNFRASTASNMDMKNYLALRNRVRELTYFKGGDLDPVALNALVKSYSTPTDPDSV